MAIRFDELSFEYAAKAVYVMNESAQEHYDSWVELQEFMFYMARDYVESTTTYVSTGGFQLTFTRSNDNMDVYVVASVMAYVANRYCEAVTNRLDKIHSLAA